jgi:lipopolysaccharide transport system permease protein
VAGPPGAEGCGYWPIARKSREGVKPGAVGGRPRPYGSTVRGRELRHLTDLVAHLARRQIDAQHRLTVLGWLWPLARTVAQLAVLVFVFSRVLDLGIEDYALFVFTGLLVWSWHSAGLSEAAHSLERGRHLVFTPRFPDVALPLVAVAAPLVDLLVAMPVLLALLLVDGRLEATALLAVPVLVALGAYTAGLGMAAASLNVLLRDVKNLVGVALMLLFYLTPIFYGLRNVPGELSWVLEANPMTHYVTGVRDVLFEGRLPDARSALVIGLAGPAAFVAGLLVFRRLQPRFVDEL